MITPAGTQLAMTQQQGINKCNGYNRQRCKHNNQQKLLYQLSINHSYYYTQNNKITAQHNTTTQKLH